MKKYDVIIIGSGQAGNSIARKFADAGKKTVLIEKRLIGGTCTNDGCTPTKTLIASAKRLHDIKTAEALGLQCESVNIDYPQIKQRKDKLVEQQRQNNYQSLLDTENLDVMFGEAKFTGEKQVSVTTKDGEKQQLEAELIFINAGTSPKIPAIKGLDRVPYYTSTTLLDIEQVPESLAVLGGSYIALELGQLYQRLGSKVTIIDTADEFLSKEDRDVADCLLSILEEEAMTIHLSTEMLEVSETAAGALNITLKTKGEQRELTCSHLLVAVGRQPQTSALNLSATGVKIDDNGYINVNAKLETNIPGIFAVGEVNGGPAFTHIAYNDFIIVRQNLLEGKDVGTENRILPYCIFTDPQLGRVGMSEKEAKEKNLDYEIAVLPMEKTARGAEVNQTKGMMKAIVDKGSKQLLGAAILAEQGGEIMSVLEMAMIGKVDVVTIRNGIFAHPTYAESLNNLFMEIME